MRIKIHQFLFGASHSWGIVGQNIGRALIKLGHEVDFISTNGLEDKYIPDDLRPYIKTEPNKFDYDCQISYTAPHNWPNYLRHGNKNRFGIWNYEYPNKKGAKQNLLKGFAKYHNATTFVLPSSNFSKEVFLSMGVPEEKMRVIPHGINLEDYKNPNIWKLKTDKKYRFLLNVSQPHKRKNLGDALTSWGKAFNKDHDVCLVAKVFKKNKGNHQFDVDFDALYKSFEKKFPNHAEVELVYDYVPNIADMYAACNINFSATFAEAWHLPSLESLASGLINVVPRYGGQLDFCNDDNSLLIEGKITRAPRSHQYWNFNPYAVHFQISTDDAAEKLQRAVYEYDELKEKFSDNMKKTAEKFTWKNVALQIIDLV